MKMKKVKVSWLSLAIASVFLSVFGGIWYGAIFNELQQKAHRYTAEDYADNSPIWYFGGLIISLLISWGIGKLIELEGSGDFRSGIKSAFKAILGFGLPLISSPLVFSPLHDWGLYAVGLSQIVIGWSVVGAILGGMSKEVVLS